MRKSYLKAVLSLFLQVPASITWAQKIFVLFFCLSAFNTKSQVTKTLNGTVSYHSGVSETRLPTVYGDVFLTLPTSLAGSTISGIVHAEPAGKTEGEKKKNQKELLKTFIMLDDFKIQVKETPQPIEWKAHADRQMRTTVELMHVSGARLATTSLPPVLSSPVTAPDIVVPRYFTPSKIVVKGDNLNLYADQPFPTNGKFVFVDGAGQSFSLKTFCSSSEQAVFKIPANAAPGECTIRKEELTASTASNVSLAKFKLIDIQLSSPNTNLKPGEVSFVNVTVNIGNSQMRAPVQAVLIDPKLTEKDTAEAMQIPVMNIIELRNPDPGIVTMQGGNRQSINLANEPNTNGIYQIIRTITGVSPGNFTVDATLFEDQTTSNDPFQPQLQQLNNAEEYNTWREITKKDLASYSQSLSDSPKEKILRSNLQRVIEHLPRCNDQLMLGECKAVAYSLLQSLHMSAGERPGKPHLYNDLVGILNPVKKQLTVIDAYRAEILSSLNAVPQSNGKYLIQALTPTNKLIAYEIDVLAAPAQSTFDPQAWLVDYLTEKTRKDTTAGTVLTTYKDSTGTWYRFFKDAKCETGAKETNIDCFEHHDFIKNPDGSYDMKKTGIYMKINFLALNQCKKGTEFCTEVLQVFKISYYYSDKNCSVLTKVETVYEFGCK